jgi:hypothetical protein
MLGRSMMNTQKNSTIYADQQGRLRPPLKSKIPVLINKPATAAPPSPQEPAPPTPAAPDPEEEAAIVISKWFPAARGSRKGVFSATFPSSGMTINGLTYHTKNALQWIQMPAPLQLDFEIGPDEAGRWLLRRSAVGRAYHCHPVAFVTRGRGKIIRKAILKALETSGAMTAAEVAK